MNVLIVFFSLDHPDVSKDKKIIRLLLRKAIETANNVAEILENQKVITNYIQMQNPSEGSR